MIRLLIAAPAPVTRAGLEALAASNPEFELVGSVPDLQGAEDLRPDVILAAMALEETPSPPERGTIPMVLLTHDADPVWSADALHAGVRALLGRDVSQAEILATVDAAAQGMAVIDPHDLEMLLSSPAPTLAAEQSELTTREREVLRMLAEGIANKIIAWKLGISEHTVKFHVASIMAKLGASSRTEAVTMGIRQGLVLL